MNPRTFYPALPPFDDLNKRMEEGDRTRIAAGERSIYHCSGVYKLSPRSKGEQCLTPAKFWINGRPYCGWHKLQGQPPKPKPERIFKQCPHCHGSGKIEVRP